MTTSIKFAMSTFKGLQVVIEILIGFSAFCDRLRAMFSTEVAIDVLAVDAGGDYGPMAHNTVVNYLDVLERLMVTENQPAWTPHLRSRTPLRRSMKQHFVDPSLAVAAIGATSDRPVRDLSALGLLFESLVVRDLRVFSQPLDGEVFHYRDKGGLEVDAIVQLRDSRWGSFRDKTG